MSIQEPIFHTCCDLKRNHALTIFFYVCTKPSTCWIPSTENQRKSVYTEGFTARLYDCPHFLSPLYKTDCCFDPIPKHYKDYLKYVDPITRQRYDYATPIPSDNNIIEHYRNLTPIPMIKIF